MNDLDLAQMMFGVQRFEKLIPTNNTTTIQAEAMTNSSNGVVEVLIDNQPTEVTTAYAIAKGDICLVSVTNNSPVVIGVVGKGDKVDQVIDGTLRATSAVIMNLVAGSVDADKITALEAYIKDLTAENFEAENIEATKAELTELISGDAKIDNLEAITATIGTLEATKGFFEELKAKELTAEKLAAAQAYIADLVAKNITVDDLEASNAYIDSLKTAYAEVDELVADLASVKELSVEKLDAKYAKIDLTNIQEACIKTAYIQDGAITTAKIKDAAIEQAKIKDGAVNNAKIADATITAAKIHDINADTITAGTIKTERLLLVDNDTGEVSIVKAINVANGVATDVASGNKIQAQSIEVVDLYAFDATIGGFKIGQQQLYNGKEQFTDPQSGVYIGLDGVAVGDGNLQGFDDKSPFMVKSDGTFFVGGANGSLVFDPFTGNLVLNASSLSIGSDDVSSVLQDLEDRTSNNSTKIQQNANEIIFKFDQLTEESDTNWNELRSYIRFTGDDMELGKAGNSLSTHITNNELAFVENGNRVAFINSSNLFITKAEVTDTLAINNWKWEQRQNGNLALKWRPIATTPKN